MDPFLNGYIIFIILSLLFIQNNTINYLYEKIKILQLEIYEIYHMKNRRI